MTHVLEKEFIGGGEVAGMKFTQLKKSFTGFLYRVEDEFGNIHHEVFKRTKTPVCINFEKRIYSETEFKESYPRSTVFGVSAWCIKSLSKAEEKYNQLKLN